MSITFNPQHSNNQFDNDELSLNVTEENIGTVFVLLGLPANTPTVGFIRNNMLRKEQDFYQKLIDISNAEFEDFFYEEDWHNPELRTRFHRYKRKLSNILAYCLGANCNLHWG